MRDFLNNVLANVAANLVVMVLLALLPILGLFIARITEVNPIIFNYILGGGWTCSGLLGIVWFRNHSVWRAKRLLLVAQLMSMTDIPINRFIVANFGTLTTPHIQPQIEKILAVMCRILAYRISLDDKGATLLIIRDSHFELYAQFGHRAGLDLDIRRNLTLENSLAGQVLGKDKCIVVLDCRNAISGITWKSLDRSSKFIGRAVVPVQALIENRPNTTQDIGVLCFDLKKQMRLTDEEQEVMLRIADKIASLWVLRQDQED